jgi:bifunctional polynucleotide phosphatase/kinase
LKEFYDNGFKIVIFTNQNGISKGHTTEKEIKKKVERIAEFLENPIQILIASADDKYRKPCLG